MRVPYRPAALDTGPGGHCPRLTGPHSAGAASPHPHREIHWDIQSCSRASSHVPSGEEKPLLLGVGGMVQNAYPPEDAKCPLARDTGRRGQHHSSCPLGPTSGARFAQAGSNPWSSTSGLVYLLSAQVVHGQAGALCLSPVVGWASRAGTLRYSAVAF